ncbi:aryl-alcohol dehydrogenase [Leucosporidium creatinivorum]|uniref:Aryl-alcohol dehydrogenase n=1 Tax=Leucosporidium creatinivorum TaxID=106004 RepID=A0A1Y2FY08_9BASI|nr:aryl-alcohol dehydrogenase [Leucosporidium creatinivorum]
MSADLPKQVTYRRLGKSGLKVSSIILGCMTYGNKGRAEWVIEDEEEAFKHFAAAWEAGINTWGESEAAYSNGDSEILVGKALRNLEIPRSEVVLLTKAYGTVVKDPRINANDIGDPNKSRDYVLTHGLSRKHLFQSVQDSLRRLQVDYIDVFQCHRFDYDTPIEETMDALHDLVKAGLFAAMQNYAKSKNQTTFISMQNFYNAAYREEEREMLPVCRQLGVGVIPWSPLAKGYLTRPWSEGSTRSNSDKAIKKFSIGGEADQEAINEALEKVAKARGYSMAQVAIAWILSNPDVTAPIVGSTKVESFAELAAATHIKLSAEEIASISAPYRPRAIIGHA